jgi:deazaflavin-dependent oxidoreductase (nitroreductase family)
MGPRKEAVMMYHRPSSLAQLWNRVFRAMASRGIGPGKMVTLEVRGRTSGQPRSVVVNIVAVDGRQYLVAPRGNTEWARNARVAGEAMIRRGGDRRIRLEELPVEQRAPIIQAYLKENAMVTQREFGISPKAPIEEFQRIAPDHPVFRITDA